MEYTANNNETMVNYLSSSTSAVNQNYSQPTVDPESLSFKMKNNFVLLYSIPEGKSNETLPSIEKDEMIEK
jgi:hypothetical protein